MGLRSGEEGAKGKITVPPSETTHSSCNSLNAQGQLLALIQAGQEMILPRSTCPSCGNAGLTRIERVIQGTQVFLSYYCGACEHVWQIPDVTTTPRPRAKPSAPRHPNAAAALGAPPKRRPR